MKAPSPGESISEVEINWLVSAGDFIEEGQIIAEIESDKATLEISAESSGEIILKTKESNLVKVGEVICLIDNSKSSNKEDKASKEVNFENADLVITPQKEEKSNYAKGIPSPSAAKLLKEKNSYPDQIKGSGKAGRITKWDVLSKEGNFSSEKTFDFKKNLLKTSDLLVQKIPLTKIRKAIAKKLVEVKNQTAMLTTFNEVDMSEVFRIRKIYKDEFEKTHGIKLGFMSFFTKASIKALQTFPEVNSMIEGEEQIKFGYCNISIAVSSPKGLMVPVIREAQSLSFEQIEKEIVKFGMLAREGKLTLDQMQGGTFTITNGGIFGSMLSTPILNPPQSAILGMHNIIERPVAIEGRVEVRPMMYLALSYDHRIIDGRESVGFLKCIKEAIENPIRLLLEI